MPRRRDKLAVCTQAGCPTLTRESRCATHRLTTYDTTHRAHRKQWEPVVAQGDVQCARCGQEILPGQPWHDDHDDARTGYLGPSHDTCNSGART